MQGALAQWLYQWERLVEAIGFFWHVLNVTGGEKPRQVCIDMYFFLSVNISCSLCFPLLVWRFQASLVVLLPGSTFVRAHCSSCRHCLSLMFDGQKTRDGQGESCRLQGSEIDLAWTWQGAHSPAASAGAGRSAPRDSMVCFTSNLTVFVCWVTRRVSSAKDFLNTAESTRWSWDVKTCLGAHEPKDPEVEGDQKRRGLSHDCPNSVFAAEISLVVSCVRYRSRTSDFSSGLAIQNYGPLLFSVVFSSWQKRNGTTLILWQNDLLKWLQRSANIVPVFLKGFKPRVAPQVPAAHHRELRAGRSQKHQPDPVWRVFLRSAEIRLGAKFGWSC